MSGSGNYEMITPSGMFGGTHMGPSMSLMHSGPIRFGQSNYDSNSIMPPHPLSHASIPRGLIGGPNLLGVGGDKNQALPYALVPAPSTFPFGELSFEMPISNGKQLSTVGSNQKLTSL